MLRGLIRFLGSYNVQKILTPQGGTTPTLKGFARVFGHIFFGVGVMPPELRAGGGVKNF